MPGQESKKMVLWAHLLPVSLRGGPLAREQYQTEIKALQEVQDAQLTSPKGTIKHPVSQQGVSFAYGGYTTPIGGYTGHSRDGKVRPDKVANVKNFKDHQGEFYINEPTVNLLGGVENVEKILARESQMAWQAPQPIPNVAGQPDAQAPMMQMPMEAPAPMPMAGMRQGGNLPIQIGGQVPPIRPPIQGKIPDGNYNRGFDGKVRSIEGSYLVGGEVWNQAPHEGGQGAVQPIDQFDYKTGMEKFGPGVYPITSYQMGGAITGTTKTRMGYEFGGYLPIGGDLDPERKPMDPLETGYQQDYQLGGSVYDPIGAGGASLIGTGGTATKSAYQLPTQQNYSFNQPIQNITQDPAQTQTYQAPDKMSLSPYIGNPTVPRAPGEPDPTIQLNPWGQPIDPTQTQGAPIYGGSGSYLDRFKTPESGVANIGDPTESTNKILEAGKTFAGYTMPDAGIVPAPDPISSFEADKTAGLAEIAKRTAEAEAAGIRGGEQKIIEVGDDTPGAQPTGTGFTPISLTQDTTAPDKVAPTLLDPITVEEPDDEPVAGKAPSNFYRDFGMQSLLDIAQGNSEYYENIINRTMQSHAGNAVAGEAALRQQLAQDGITGPAADALLRSYARNVRVEGDVLRGDMAGTILNEARGAAGLLAKEGQVDLAFQEQIRQFDVGDENWTKAFEQRVKEFDETHSLAVDNFDRREAWNMAGFLVDSGATGERISDFMETNFGLTGIDLSHITTGQQMNRFGVAASGLSTQIGQYITGGQEISASDPEIKKWLDQMWTNSGQDESKIGSAEYNEFAERTISSMEGANNPVNSILNQYSDQDLLDLFPGFTSFQGKEGAEGLRSALGQIIVNKEFGTDANGNYDVESQGAAWASLFKPQELDDFLNTANINPDDIKVGVKTDVEGRLVTKTEDGKIIDWENVMDLDGYAEAKNIEGTVLTDKDNDKIYVSKGDGTFDEKSYADIENKYTSSPDPFSFDANEYEKYIAVAGTDEAAKLEEVRIDYILKDGNFDKLFEMDRNDPVYKEVMKATTYYQGTEKAKTSNRWDDLWYLSSYGSENSDGNVTYTVGEHFSFKGRVMEITGQGIDKEDDGNIYMLAKDLQTGSVYRFYAKVSPDVREAGSATGNNLGFV